VIALFYSSVGFGGGSSYLAALSISEIPYSLIPKIGLICNLLVVTSGSVIYYKKGFFNKKLIFPFVFTSVPMAFLGGLYPIKESAFIGVLTISLILSGVRLLFLKENTDHPESLPSLKVSLALGGGIGLLSGIVGLGGGIFLSPILMNLKWGKPKEVAAAASFFIFLNSIAGLSGQFIKNPDVSAFTYWPLFLAVFVGGQIGSRLGSSPRVSQAMVRRGTGILILVISGKLLLGLF
jgi:uncharacterized membrane protein YfcA